METEWKLNRKRTEMERKWHGNETVRNENCKEMERKWKGKRTEKKRNLRDGMEMKRKRIENETNMVEK